MRRSLKGGAHQRAALDRGNTVLCHFSHVVALFAVLFAGFFLHIIPIYLYLLVGAYF